MTTEPNLFIANRAFEPVSQEEDRSTRHIDSDRGDLSFNSITWSESPGVVIAPGLPGVVGRTESRIPGTGH